MTFIRASGCYCGCTAFVRKANPHWLVALRSSWMSTSKWRLYTPTHILKLYRLLANHSFWICRHRVWYIKTCNKMRLGVKVLGAILISPTSIKMIRVSRRKCCAACVLCHGSIEKLWSNTLPATSIHRAIILARMDYYMRNWWAGITSFFRKLLRKNISRFTANVKIIDARPTILVELRTIFYAPLGLNQQGV